ncbi:MAG TPA: polyprenyl synthetase family protein [Candidatus Binatia bacterium]|jgi:geranylgeranyl diphosphate synthase type II|nr:polyprenyl synthetase family protein [Candidatus Binatia bacterium]
MPDAATVAEAGDLVTEVLDEYGAMTRVALTEYLAPREPQRHLYAIVADYPRRGGRMLRPSLCLAAARAFGASAADAVRSAVALELLHNAFLVHDDVEDESDVRRGRPTLHALHGVDVAVNAGDALLLLGLRALLDNGRTLGPVLSMQVLEEAERMARESVEGQAMELGWRRDNAVHLAEADYLQMILKKTCWYTTIFPLRVGALIGSRGRAPLEPLLRFGFLLGAAFQITDDLLNLWGDEVRYGKELQGDLLEGKRTLMLIRLCEQATAAERARLRAVLATPRPARTADDVRWMRERMDAYDCLTHANTVAHALAGAARHEFAAVFGSLPDSRDKRFIAALVTWVLERR